MGSRGPAPKPTALKERRGNPGKRALNRGEPEVREAAMRPPAHLGAAAKREWLRLRRKLAPAGLPTKRAEPHERWVPEYGWHVVVAKYWQPLLE